MTRVPSLVVAMALVVGGCGARADQTGAAGLAHTFESPAQLASAVLDALARRDTDALERFALGEHEFRTVVWPELPSSRPEVNLPFEYAWGTLARNSRGCLAATLNAHGGVRYELARLEFAGPATPYESFTVHRESRVVVRGADGAERRLVLFGSIIERQGAYKVFSYVTD